MRVVLPGPVARSALVSDLGSRVSSRLSTPIVWRGPLAGQMRAVSRGAVVTCKYGFRAHEASGMLPVYFGRKRPDGQVALTVWLLDNGCLGVKDAFARVVPMGQVEGIAAGHQSELIDSNPDTVLALIEQSLEYASGLGFSPLPDVAKLLPIFR